MVIWLWFFNSAYTGPLPCNTCRHPWTIASARIGNIAIKPIHPRACIRILEYRPGLISSVRSAAARREATTPWGLGFRYRSGSVPRPNFVI